MWSELLLRPTLPQLAAYLVVPLILTLLLEHLSVRVWGRWSYAAEMPVLPVIGTGLAPVLQWIVLPLVIAWLVRRHLT